jgi:toxin ParE1/3/4
MAARVIWSDEALDDIEAISDYIRATNPAAATRYTDAILAGCAKLKNFPEAGRRYNQRYRALVVRNHIVFYTFDRGLQTVRIATVLDGRRDIGALLDEDS